MLLAKEDRFDFPANPFSEEKKVLESLLQEFSWLKGAELIQIGQLGWLIDCPNAPRYPDIPLLSLDFDDLLVDSVGAKTALRDRVTAYLISRSRPSEGQAVVNPPEATLQLRNQFEPIATQLVKISDTFARWPHPGTTEAIYHCEAQVAALAFGLKILIPCLNSSNDACMQKLTEIEALLQQVHQQPDSASRTLPWSVSGDKLMLPPQPLAHHGSTQQLIRATLLQPEPLSGVVAGITQLLQRHRLNVMLHSSGVPSFQLQKIGLFFERSAAFRPATIALARGDKGEFLQQISPELRTRYAQLLRKIGINHLDDLPKVAGSLTAAIPELTEIDLAVGRCKLRTGKAALQDWLPDHERSRQFDFSGLDIASADFPSFFATQVATWLRSNNQVS